MDNAINYQHVLSDEIQGLQDETLPNLLQSVHLFKESILIQNRKAVRSLQSEFSEWEHLSDEALIGF